MSNLSEAFTPEEWEHMVNNADATLVPQILATTIVLSCFSVLFVGLRLVARIMTFHRLKLDWSDWLCLLALFLSVSMMVSAAVGTRFGLGRHMVVIEDIRAVYIFFILLNGFHPVAMCSLKLSLLFLYRSIFYSRRFRWWCLGVGVFIVLWTVVAMVGGVALCVPLEKLWDPTIGGFCLPLAPLGLAITLCHIVTDFIILFMPIPMVMRLNTTRRKKSLIIMTFLVGGGACIVSIARLPVWISRESTLNVGWDQVPSGLLAMGELTVGLLAACFPVYRPLLHWFSGKDNKASTVGAGSISAHANTKSKTAFSQAHGKDLPLNSGSLDASTSRSERGIRVTDEFELVVHRNQGDDGWSRVPDQDTDHLFRPSAPGAATN